MVEEGRDVKELFVRGKEKEVEVEGFKFRIRKLSWGDKEDVRNASVKRDPSGRVDVDLKEMNLQTLVKGMVKAPFEISKENLLALEPSVGNELLLKISGFSSLGEVVEKNLSDSSEEKAKSD